VVVRLDADTTVPEGEEIELAFDPRDMYLFDPATGESLKNAAVPQPA
jgi:hypothetical protein